MANLIPYLDETTKQSFVTRVPSPQDSCLFRMSTSDQNLTEPDIIPQEPEIVVQIPKFPPPVSRSFPVLLPQSRDSYPTNE
jgi:hypothetical protein